LLHESTRIQVYNIEEHRIHLAVEGSDLALYLVDYVFESGVLLVFGVREDDAVIHVRYFDFALILLDGQSGVNKVAFSFGGWVLEKGEH